MIEIEQRIKTAATDDTLRAAASALWQKHAPQLFEPHDERNGLRVSDAGACVRALWSEIHGVTKKAFEPTVQLFNLDEGTMTGCWWACLLAASLEADKYYVELEPEVSHDGVPGHIDLYYAFPPTLGKYHCGVVEFKKTGSYKAEPQPWQVLQLLAYCAAKGVEDGAIVTIAPAAKAAKIAVTWYKLSENRDKLRGEQMRLQAAVGPVEPEGDAQEAFRCRGCPVVKCNRNPEFRSPDLTAQLAASVAAQLEAR